jgi:hypothetical protein
MAELQTNFDVAPFYDDYDEDKQYYRMLFRPATAVQARELTQLQTMMQKQISRFGSSIYKDGSVVEGCNFTSYPAIPQVKFTDGNTSTIDFSLIVKGNSDVANSQSHLTNSYLLVSNTTGLRAAVFDAFVGAEAVVNQGAADTNRAYVLYLNSGNNAGQQISTFKTVSERVDVYNPNQDKMGPLVSTNRVGVLYTLSSNSTVNALGVGYGIHIGQGIVYQKGFFLKTLADNFIIKEHSSNIAGIRVGFNTAESIVKPAADNTLYDNSIGSPNQNAPGAYRLKLVPSLVSYDSANTQVTIPTDFLPIVDFDNGIGVPVNSVVDPQYSLIGDMIAQRTKEESGDYIVRPFQVNVEASSNSQTFYYTVSPGTAYVDGYRINYDVAQRIEVNRATYTQSVNNQISTMNFGNYIKVKELVGIIDVGSVPDIGIYNTPQSAISNNASISAPLGTWVGNANVKAVIFNSGQKGTPTADYLLYLSNIRMQPGYNFETSAKSFYVNGTYGKVWADISLANVNSNAAMSEVLTKKLIFDTGLTGVKRLTSNTGVNNTSYIYRTTSSSTTLTRGTGGTLGIATASFNLPSDTYNYGVTSTGDTIQEKIHVMFVGDYLSNLYSSGTTLLPNTNWSNATHSVLSTPVPTAGQVTFISNYNATDYTQNPKVGENIQIANGTTVSYHTITAVTSANSIQVTPPITLIPVPSSGFAVRKYHKAGSYVNFNGTGNVISFSGTPVTTASISLSMDLYPYTIASGSTTTQTFALQSQIPSIRTTAVPILKDVKKETVIGINCASHYATTTGPWSLGMPDVYKITGVYVGASFANTNPNRIDWFEYDNGQTDQFYGLAQLKILPQYKSQITSASRMLVQFSHFTPNLTASQATFFSKDSYSIDDANTANTTAIQTAQIPIFKSTDGTNYDLRNYIDMRPVLSNTANVYVAAAGLAGMTINPANNQSIYYSTASTKLAIEPDSSFTFNVEYYLPRADALLITKEKRVVVKSGAPAFNPKPPILNNSGMKIADIVVPPYPSLTFQEAE